MKKYYKNGDNFLSEDRKTCFPPGSKAHDVMLAEIEAETAELLDNPGE